jgi:galactitol-specific phosphotransferase system IIB component
VKNILTSIDSFDVKASGYVSNKENKINASTNLDKKISDGFKKELSKELEKLKSTLKRKINKALQEKLKDINVDQKEIDKIKKYVDGKNLNLSSIQDTISDEFKNKAKNIAQDKADKGKKKLEDRAKKELQKMFKF